MRYVRSLPIQLFIGILLPVPVFIGILLPVPVFIGILLPVPVFIGILLPVPVFMAIFLPFLPLIFVCLWWWCLKILVFTSFKNIMAVFFSLTTIGPALIPAAVFFSLSTTCPALAAAVTDIKKQTASKIPSVFFICFNIFLSPSFDLLFLFNILEKIISRSTLR